MRMDLVWDHLLIVVLATLFSILCGVPLGVAAYLFKPARKVILWVSEILQTIPSLALLGLVMLVFGPGKLTVIVGLVLYSLLPIVHNTFIGLDEVDAGVKEAARGMGLSRFDRLISVELPLAFPMVFAGIRIAIVTTVGVAVFAASVGGGGLGSVINKGIRTQNMKMLFSGTIALMVMAMALDMLMALAEKVMTSRKKA